MNIRTYAIETGGTGMRDCPVLADLATKAGCSAHVLYLIGLGHKAPSPELAFRIHESSGRKIACDTMRADVDWQRDADGRVTGYQVRLGTPAGKGKKVGGDASSVHSAQATRPGATPKSPRVKGRQGEVAHG